MEDGTPFIFQGEATVISFSFSDDYYTKEGDDGSFAGGSMLVQENDAGYVLDIRGAVDQTFKLGDVLTCFAGCRVYNVGGGGCATLKGDSIFWEGKHVEVSPLKVDDFTYPNWHYYRYVRVEDVAVAYSADFKAYVATLGNGSWCLINRQLQEGTYDYLVGIVYPRGDIGYFPCIYLREVGTVGIEGVRTDAGAEGEYYDLAGRRVVAPAAGVYILRTAGTARTVLVK